MNNSKLRQYKQSGNLMRKRIVFIHHGGIKGGAPISLHLLMQALDPSKFECVVLCAVDEVDVINYFLNKGFRAYGCRLQGFAHTTLCHYNLMFPSGWNALLAWVRQYKTSCERLDGLLNEIQPDLVHFNSLTLAPYVKIAAKLNISTVLHVREPVVPGWLGLRRQWLRKSLVRYATRVICICHDNADRLNLPAGKVVVIYNPVDFNKFDYLIDPIHARRNLGVTDDALVTLFAGGSVPAVKGLSEYLESMGRIKLTIPQLVCLMPSFNFPASPSQRQWTLKRRFGKLLGIYRKADKIFGLTQRNHLYECIVRSEFTNNIEHWIAASDIVCAPHIEPHFSRTVIEAGAMKKPVVGFRIGGIEEVVVEGETGMLAPIGDIDALTAATLRLANDKVLRMKLGLGGYNQALELFQAGWHQQQVEQVYNEILR